MATRAQVEAAAGGGGVVASSRVRRDQQLDATGAVVFEADGETPRVKLVTVWTLQVPGSRVTCEVDQLDGESDGELLARVTRAGATTRTERGRELAGVLGTGDDTVDGKGGPR